MTAVPLCTTCKWVLTRNDATPAYLCMIPVTDPVTGLVAIKGEDCAVERTTAGDCGPTGTLWDATV